MVSRYLKSSFWYLPGEKIFTWLVFSAGLILPGLGHLFYHHISLYKDLEIFQLLLASIFISFPIFLLSFVYAMIFQTPSKKSKDRHMETLFFAGLLSVIAYYYAFIMAFIINIGLTNIFNKNPIDQIQTTYILIGLAFIYKIAKQFRKKS